MNPTLLRASLLAMQIMAVFGYGMDVDGGWHGVAHSDATGGHARET